MRAASMNSLVGLSRTAVVLALAQVAVGAAMGILGNPDGWLGAAFYGLAYAVPLLLVALALRQGSPARRKIAGWAAAALAASETFIVVANWDGYTSAQATFALAVTVPGVLLYAVIFWAAILRREPRSGPAGRAAA